MIEIRLKDLKGTCKGIDIKRQLNRKTYDNTIVNPDLLNIFSLLQVIENKISFTTKIEIVNFFIDQIKDFRVPYYVSTEDDPKMYANCLNYNSNLTTNNQHVNDTLYYAGKPKKIIEEYQELRLSFIKNLLWA